jgi:pyridinium-3,5-bisthiocarboxylic acid mononucleotide nickel chelatase
MTYIYFDAKSGLSGDMILGALLDLGVPRAEFKARIAELKLPVRVTIKDVKRSHLRGLKVDVHVQGHGSHARTWKDISSFIKKTPFLRSVKERGLAVFENLFKAEAKVHGEPFDRVHLHEAGADDALADVLGSVWLLDRLGVGPVLCSPLNVGSGWVKTSHGVLPVPPPAVAELLKNVPVYSAHADAELVTPTGAAIVKTLVTKFVSFPELVYDRIGYGAGGRDLPGLPNILRAFLGDAAKFDPAKQVYLIEATVDDSTPQVLAAFLDRALELGALDVHLTPVVMKKNRLATKLTLLAALDKIDRLIDAVFRETSSIGVRYFPVERRALDRTVDKVRLLGETVGIKVATLGDETVHAQPEYDDCRALARKTGRPLKDIIRRALEAYAKKS